MDNKDASTAMTYAYALNKPENCVKNPFDEWRKGF
jgi:hypothetical protein